MTCTKLHYLPLTVSILSPILVLLTYFIALQLEHIRAYFAYISDTGTTPPEMCVFALGLSFLAMLVMATVYVRYKQVEEYINLDGSGRGRLLNKTGLVTGLIAGVGIVIVGSFQETSQLLVHITGAIMTFMFGSVFFIIQGILTKTTMGGSWSVLAYLRTMVGVICLILFLISYSTGIASLSYFKGDSILKWEPKNGGWTLRVISTVTEWVMASLFNLYFLSFVPEFKRISCEPARFRIVSVSPEPEAEIDDTTSAPVSVEPEPDQPQLITVRSPSISRDEENKIPKKSIAKLAKV